MTSGNWLPYVTKYAGNQLVNRPAVEYVDRVTYYFRRRRQFEVQPNQVTQPIYGEVE